MPCTDITEIVTLRLDPQDCFESYSLNKKTCGRGLGEASLLAGWVRGQHVADMSEANVEAFLDEFSITDETEEFLYLKHFFALKFATLVLLGEENGAASESCAVETVAYDADGMEFTAHLKVDVITNEIKSCGRCKGCGSKKAKA